MVEIVFADKMNELMQLKDFWENYGSVLSILTKTPLPLTADQPSSSLKIF